jgi:hypothetical protein
MSKPLELAIYPHWEHNEICYANVEGLDSPISVDYWIACKRLTDAELAAEFWKAKERCMFVSAFSGMSISPDSPSAREAITLHRFATLPSYDEATK